jgi:hypothetical protein
MFLGLLLKYRRQIAVVLFALAVIGICLYIRAVFAERDQLKLDKALLNERLKSAAAMQELTNKISDAIGQIQIRSQVNVQRIQTEAKPVFVDSRPLPFIPGGVLQSVYSSAAAGRAAPSAAPGRHVPPGQSAGGVLPDG